MVVQAREVREALTRDGYYRSRVSTTREEAVRCIVRLARALGETLVPEGCDPNEPVIRTAPTRDVLAAPFDRPAGIGWHGDFATHPERPELSLVYVTHGDPHGLEFGEWRLASVRRLVSSMRSTAGGRAALAFLSTEELPFSYAEGEEHRWFRVFEPRAGTELGAALLRRGLFRLFIGVCARGRSLFGAPGAGIAPSPASFRAASPA